MKKPNLKVLFFVNFLALFSCEEVPTVVTPAQQAGECPPAAFSAVVDQQRQVLVEEFTGVKCVNCPDGSEALKALIDQYGDQVVAVSLHAGFFSEPYSQSLYDFRTPAGDALLNFLGSPFGYPAAIIDRKTFGGNPRLHMGQGLWPGAIAEQLEAPPKVKIHLELDFEEVSRELEVRATLFFENDIEGEVRISAMITEDKVKDYQETPSGLQADYEHNHILRRALTNPTGNILNEPTTAGSVFCKSFSTTISSDWKAADCKLILFVHRDSEQKEVLQAHQASLLE